MAQLVVPELGELCVVIAAGDEFSTRLTSVGAVDRNVGDVLRRALKDARLSDLARESAIRRSPRGRMSCWTRSRRGWLTAGSRSSRPCATSWRRWPSARAWSCRCDLARGPWVWPSSGRCSPKWHFTGDDLSLMREVADRVSRALENARLFGVSAAGASQSRGGGGRSRGGRTAIQVSVCQRSDRHGTAVDSPGARQPHR